MSCFGGTYKFGLPYVFISYSSVDRDIIEQFINILGKYEIDVWVDYAAIEYGKSIVECIEQGIQNASAILCIISNNSTKSNWCKVEYESALTKEIESGKTLIIPIILGRPQIPFLLRHKKYFPLELTNSGEIIFDKKKYDELAYSIKKQRTENNLVELISLSEFQNKESNIRKETSIISLIIGSVLKDFPVNKIVNKDFIDGKHMKEIYLTVSNLIEEFELEIATLLKIFTEEKIGHYIDYSKCLKYNVVLKDIQYNMKALASSLKNISGINSDLCYRFEKISNICMEIANIECKSIELVIGFDNIKDQKRIPDLMSVDCLKNGGGHYDGNPYIQIQQLSKTLEQIYKYKNELLNAISNITV